MSTAPGPCRVCGAPDHSCPGSAPLNAREIITASGIVRTNAPVRVPRQRTHLGRAGYIGNVQEYDEKTPHIQLVRREELTAADLDEEQQAEEPGAPAADGITAETFASLGITSENVDGQISGADAAEAAANALGDAAATVEGEPFEATPRRGRRAKA